MTKVKKQSSLDVASAVETLIDTSASAVAIAEQEDFVEELSEKRIEHRKRRRHRATCGDKTLHCIKKTAVYLLSYVGMTCMVVAYSIIGGFIFVALEGPNEELIQSKASQLRLNYTREIAQKVNYTIEFFLNHNKMYTGFKLDDMLYEFQLKTFELVNKEGWTPMSEETGGDQKWNYAGALLYSVTVITTIGYGFITPKTVPGQAITMIYALIGIPLTILCLSNIGKAMASFVRALYGKTLCVECRYKFIESVKVRRTSSIAVDKIELDQIENHIEKGPDEAETKKIIAHAHETEVPILLCMILLVWYIMFGAIMFTIWETDWDLFTGAYFCFITLSTIGFGDIVPGFSRRDWDDQIKQVACSFYLLIGLSTLAMVFDLMQQRGKTLAAKFASFIGLVKKKEVPSNDK